MPKRLMIVLCVVALAIAACHSDSSTTPTPSFSPVSTSPNPKITAAHILVTINGLPKAKIPVEESTPRSTASPRPGTPFETLLTNRKGKVTFTHLKPAKTYCWVALLGTGKKSFFCADWQIWQTTDITLGF
jgi:hypothetical protein